MYTNLFNAKYVITEQVIPRLDNTFDIKTYFKNYSEARKYFQKRAQELKKELINNKEFYGHSTRSLNVSQFEKSHIWECGLLIANDRKRIGAALLTMTSCENLLKDCAKEVSRVINVN